MNNDTSHHTILKRVSIGILVVVAIVGVGIGVAFLFKELSARFSATGAPTGNTQQTNNAPSAPSAASVLSDFSSLGTVSALANGYQSQQTSGSTVTVKEDGQTYTTSVPTKASALYFATQNSEPNDSQSILNQTNTFMSNHSFTKVSAPLDASIPQGQTVTTYTDLGATCQLTSSPTSVPEFYTFACVDKSDIDKQYASIQSLLAIYEKTNPLSPFTRAIASTTTSGNMAMTTISLNVQGAHPLLLFAAVNNNWQYLGDLGSGDSSNGKYTLPPSVQTAIHDPKYGDFLTHNLQY